MIKIALLCLLSVVVYSKPAVNEQEGSRSVTFLELIKSQKVPKTGRRFDISGSLSLFSGPYCSGAKSVYACDGRCSGAEGKPLSLEADNLPSGYKAEINYFGGQSCDDRYLGYSTLDSGTCYTADKDTFKTLGSFSCFPVTEKN